MSTDIIQSDYERLETIAARFSKQAEVVEAIFTAVNGSMEPLQNGGWAGQGASAFFSEMDSLTIPGLNRLRDALAEASRVTNEIIQILKEAEDEAAAPFRGGDGGGVVVGQPVGGSGGTVGGGGGSGQPFTGQPVGGSGGTVGGGGGAAGPTNPSIPDQFSNPTDPSNVFNEDYMRNFIGSEFQGQNDPRLNDLLEQLHRASPAKNEQVNNILDQIADIRGVDRGEFRAQYDKFLELREAAFQRGGDYPAIDTTRHPDFLGSQVALRYGAVAGDVLGVDPVFGSLLNPTGGLVGPGDDAYFPGPNDAVGYHGIFHDAAGYLYNYHDQGPGYDYHGREIIFDTSNPLGGQVGGISWWMQQPGLSVDVPAPDIPYVPRFVEVGVAEALDSTVVPAIRLGSATVEGGADIVDGIGDVFSGDFGEGFSDIGDGLGTIGRGIGRSVIDIFD